MSHYQQLRFYDPFTDAMSIRFSIVDERGSEYFAVVPVGPAGSLRTAARERALEALEMAVERDRDDPTGAQPGEVRVA